MHALGLSVTAYQQNECAIARLQEGQHGEQKRYAALTFKVQTMDVASIRRELIDLAERLTSNRRHQAHNI